VAFSFSDFVKLRPRLFHLTARENAARIERDLQIFPAADLIRESQPNIDIRKRRPEGLYIDADGERIHLRDQAPLHAGNIELQGGWSFERFVEELNSHVFFWPGTASGPVSSGRRHFARYASDDVLVFDLNTLEVLGANREIPPRFCKYNSGSPRCSYGLRSPRGPSTFVGAETFTKTGSGVVEVVFRGRVRLDGCCIRKRSIEEFVQTG